jgi:BirA family transcriptional regulator, biotin operon repressor / biotin---[acetyl-CoA-carboxylase] ligase
MLDCLRASEIKAAVAEKNDVDIDIVIHQKIDSTNSWSLQQCKSGKNLPFVCFAEEQTQGRGRRGKQWLMSARSNIAMSISWPFALSQMQLSRLPLSVAMSIVETLESFGLKHVQVKWPNDVFVQGKKIAGILIETQTMVAKAVVDKTVTDKTVTDKTVADKVTDKQVSVVIGVGLNFEMPAHKVKTNQDGLDVYSEITDVDREVKAQRVGSNINRTMVAKKLLVNVIRMVQRYKLDSGYYLAKFRTQYDYCKEKNIEVMLDDKTVLSGVAQGITDDAELLVNIDGKECVFNSAEISLKL